MDRGGQKRTAGCGLKGSRDFGGLNSSGVLRSAPDDTSSGGLAGEEMGLSEGLGRR